MTVARTSGVKPMSALRFRLVTLSVVAAFLGVSHLACREPEARSYGQYLFVITLGPGLVSALNDLKSLGGGR